MSTNAHPTWQHTFAQALPELVVEAQAQEFPAPKLLLLNDALTTSLGIDPAWLKTQAGLDFLTGRAEGAAALAYAGHQFGQYSPLLGDGRALLLAEVSAEANAEASTQPPHLYDIQAKGTGRTVFSRGGDGKCTIAAALREYVMSEALHALGIATTRALAVISTGEMIQRAPSPAFDSEDQALPPVQPGGIIVRVASSHLRVGTFELVRRSAPELLPRLTAYAARRHGYGDVEGVLRGVVKQQADLVAQWMAAGFVHGVMNTDNCTISGETIDYGPCAFLDGHDARAVFSSIDTQGRYAFGAQPTMAAWNVGRLAEALLPELGEPNEALELAQEIVDGFADCFTTSLSRHWLPKLGIPADGAGELDSATALLRRWQGLLASVRPDHTNAHRALRDLVTSSGADAGSDSALPAEFATWIDDWRAFRTKAGIADKESLTMMNQANPVYIPRNHLVTEALVEADGLAREGATQLPAIERLLDAVTAPFTPRTEIPARYAQPAPKELGAFTSYCGT